MKISARSLQIAALALASWAYAAKFGDRHCVSNLCLTAVYDDQASSVEYQAVYTGTVGWVGIGQGEEMAGANMMVGWPSNGNVVLSQRTTPSQCSSLHFRNQSPGVRAQRASLYDHTPHIWASSPGAPASSDPSAAIQRHNRHGFISLDFTQPVNVTGQVPDAVTSTGTADGGGGNSESSTVRPMRDLSRKPVRLFLAHMIFMTIAWMGLVPAGILVGRFGRSYRSWLKYHRAIQLASLAFITIGFALGVSGVKSAGGPHFENTHQRLGLAMFVLVLIQAAGGQVGHIIFRSKGIRLQNYGHMLLGVVLFFGLSLYQIREGFKIWMWRAPKGVYDIFFPLWFALITVVWLGGTLLLPRQVKAGKAGRDGGGEKLRLGSQGTSSP
ncbi:hypothetical protein V8E36_005565 [Tilletia maclaganii]